MSMSATVVPFRPRPSTRPGDIPTRPLPPDRSNPPLAPVRPLRPAALVRNATGDDPPGGGGGRRRRPGRRHERGQATAEYALVVLAAAALAGLLLAWAAGTDGIGRLFDAVMDSLIDRTG